MEHAERPKQNEVSEWYLEIGKKSLLFDYGPVKGMIIIRPYGYAIWEEIQKTLDPKIKSLGCQNAYFPLLIPESFIAKEKDHVRGFSPEVAIVTHAGGKKLEEPLIIRPTSETIMYALFSKWISSYRDLPFKINQWTNVIRWEMRPFPFLRTTEFLWHEAHTVHATLGEATNQIEEALKMYQSFFEELLAIPVLIGKKTEREKFAGALYSTSCEALLMDGKALQIATAHNLGQNFSRPFDIMFQNQNGQKEYTWQTSWGLSTRAIGGLLLTHGDKKGFIFPPKIAPIQIIIIPINKNRDVLSMAEEIKTTLSSLNIRIQIDMREQVTPGWKFNDWEMKGIPLRIEIGPRDLKKNTIVAARRDTGEKIILSISELREKVPNLLNEIQTALYERAKSFVADNTFEVSNFAEFIEIIEGRRGFIKAPWCGDEECERLIKEKTKATTRCIPSEGNDIRNTDKCVYCGRKAKLVPIWARAH